jgi:hypothetical protein
MNYRLQLKNTEAAAEASTPDWDTFKGGLLRTLQNFPDASDAILKFIRSRE